MTLVEPTTNDVATNSSPPMRPVSRICKLAGSGDCCRPPISLGKITSGTGSGKSLGLVWGGQLGEGQLEGTQIVRTPNSRDRRDESDRLTDYFLRHGAVIDPRDSRN